jgi:hypothetical protein
MLHPRNEAALHNEATRIAVSTRAASRRARSLVITRGTHRVLIWGSVHTEHEMLLLHARYETKRQRRIGPSRWAWP